MVGAGPNFAGRLRPGELPRLRPDELQQLGYRNLLPGVTRLIREIHGNLHRKWKFSWEHHRKYGTITGPVKGASHVW